MTLKKYHQRSVFIILVVIKSTFGERFKKSCLKSIKSAINTEKMILGLKGSVLKGCQLQAGHDETDVISEIQCKLPGTHYWTPWRLMGASIM